MDYCKVFHVNCLTGCGVMATFVYKELTRNLEIANTACKVWPISGD